MQTITYKAETIKLTASDVRALTILRNCGYVAAKGNFEEGSSRRYTRYILPRAGYIYQRIDGAERLRPNVWMRLGAFDYVSKTTDLEPFNKATRARIVRFFRAHPRNHVCVVGNPRVINELLAKCS